MVLYSAINVDQVAADLLIIAVHAGYKRLLLASVKKIVGSVLNGTIENAWRS